MGPSGLACEESGGEGEDVVEGVGAGFLLTLETEVPELERGRVG